MQNNKIQGVSNCNLITCLSLIKNLLMKIHSYDQIQKLRQLNPNFESNKFIQENFKVVIKLKWFL